MLLFGSRVFADWVYDPNPPTITVTCGGTAISNNGTCNAQSATVTCTDSETGCHSITHTVNNGTASAQTFSGPPYTSPQTKTINYLAGAEIDVWATDGAGNNSTPFPFTFFFPLDCTLDPSPDPVTIQEGANGILTVGITTGSADTVRFTSNSTNIATVNPAAVTPNCLFSTCFADTTVTGESVGQTTIHIEGETGGLVCGEEDVIVDVTQAGAWWQVEDADVLASGNITSSIPAACTSPSCDPTFNLDGEGGYPGVTMYTGSKNFGSGSVANPAWVANSSYNGPVYDYDWFAKFVPSEAFDNPIGNNTIGGSNLSTGGYQAPNGYVWRYREGNLTINSTANLGSDKVILLVKSGNLTINNNVTLTEGTGFFAAIVQGDIILDPNVSHPNNPSLMGIYMADNQFKTGVGSGRLIVKGSVVGWGKTTSPGIVLERDLEGNNGDTPAETIIYDPGLSLTFPRELMRKGVTWKEIAP